MDRSELVKRVVAEHRKRDEAIKSERLQRLHDGFNQLWSPLLQDWPEDADDLK